MTIDLEAERQRLADRFAHLDLPRGRRELSDRAVELLVGCERRSDVAGWLLKQRRATAQDWQQVVPRAWRIAAPSQRARGSIGEWSSLFRRAGYTEYGGPATAPTEPVTVYRGGVNAVECTGYSWSVEPRLAALYAERVRGGARWKVLAPPAALLARFSTVREGADWAARAFKASATPAQRADQARHGRGLADEFVVDHRDLTIEPWTADEAAQWPAMTPGELPDDLARELQMRAITERLDAEAEQRWLDRRAEQVADRRAELGVQRALDNPDSATSRAIGNYWQRQERRERILSGHAGDEDVRIEAEMIEGCPWDAREDRQILRLAGKR